MYLTNDYLNPKHAVPVLIVDGQPLTENVAILQWISDSFPAFGLMPVSGMNNEPRIKSAWI